jgi:hypothetical protein
MRTVGAIASPKWRMCASVAIAGIHFEFLAAKLSFAVAAPPLLSPELIVMTHFDSPLRKKKTDDPKWAIRHQMVGKLKNFFLRFAGGGRANWRGFLIAVRRHRCFAHW